MSGSLDQEYAALAARLREKKSERDARYYLNLLERGYADPAQRLDALKLTLRQLGVSDDPSK